VSLLAAAPDLAGVEVIDGPSLPDTSATQAVYVGQNPADPSAPAVDGSAAREGLGGPDREQYTIHCAAQVLNGDGDIVAARVQAYALAGAALGVVAASRRLRGLPLIAGPGAGSRHQAQSGDTGALATVMFDVGGDAYTSR